jgi:hypothetical protein
MNSKWIAMGFYGKYDSNKIPTQVKYNKTNYISLIFELNLK